MFKLTHKELLCCSKGELIAIILELQDELERAQIAETKAQVHADSMEYGFMDWLHDCADENRKRNKICFRNGRRFHKS